MNQIDKKKKVLVAVVATVLLISVSGLSIGHMVSFVDATKPRNNDDDNNNNSPALPQSGVPAAGPNNGNDGGTGIGTGASDISTQQATAFDMQGAAVAAAASSNPACGGVVSGLVNLTANLNCSGDGIIVGGPNTVINMNGFSITGPGQDRL